MQQLQLAFEGKDKPKRKFGPIKIDGDKQEWPCKHCTTKNKMSSLACSTCSKPRFEAATSNWSCPKCTFSNPDKNVKCGMCDFKRKVINCPACTLEYSISKRKCLCGTANPAYKPPTFGRSGVPFTYFYTSKYIGNNKSILFEEYILAFIHQVYL